MSRYELPTCRWRHPVEWRGRVGCASPLRQSGPFGVPEHICTMCEFADHLDQSCPAAPAPQAGQVRHLLYHCYPVGDWRDHMRILRDNLSLFNGRRVLALAVGPETAGVDEVRGELAGLDVDLLRFDNDPSLKERVTFPTLLAALRQYQSRSDVTFYGHTKGVVSSKVMGPAARRWADAMYEALLGHWPAVRSALQTHAAVGIFQRHWQGPVPTRAQWHYSGSFRWWRNQELYARDWQHVDPTWLGSETHIGLVFGRGEAACLYGEFATQDCGLYADSEWERWAEPQRRAWISAHLADRRAPSLLTVILTAHAQPELVHDAIASVQAQTDDAWQLLVVDSGAIAATGAYDRYGDDARISVMLTGETAEQRQAVAMQSWAINEAWRRGRVRGDLIMHLCDDDVLAPAIVATMRETARLHPDQSAWYGPAQRVRLHASGLVQQLGLLATVGVASPSNILRCRVDGMQVCHRRSARVDWPEKRELAALADGWWMDALSSNTPIHPVNALVGVHRHTPLSTFTT